jgi:glutamate-1-semialdehyde 2,1-aminomutase
MYKKINLKNSNKIFTEASKIIPLASQTFSKSHLLYDKRYYPLFASEGKDQYLIDLDKNKYLDFVSALGSVSIGYSNSHINKKIFQTLNKGIIFSLSHPLELKVAKLLKKIIPSAQMVRFGKNGTDVNSAAIRLARYITGRDKIAVCGYHGWQDWYISSTSMNGGIPKKIMADTKRFEFNNIESLERLFKKNKYAAVIIEPLASELPNNNFLSKIRKLCNKHKTILIFDEICTGFRVDLKGVQNIYKVIPDLTTLGKAMGNGFPISALVGKKKYMRFMDKIFYSGTFAGETLSLKACYETIKFMIRKKTINKNILNGLYLKNKFNNIVKKYKLEKYITLSGHPSWLFLKIMNVDENLKKKIKAIIMQELINNKILFIGSFNINYSHNRNNINYLLKIIEKTLFLISLNFKKLDNILYTKLPKTLFKIRN